MTRTVLTPAGEMVVHTYGEGDPIVLLHANPGEHLDYAAVIPSLSAQWTVHAVDWPGFGLSPLPGQASAVGWADALPSLLVELGGGPFALIGNSVGGFAAARTAARHPELVRALVLVQPGGFTRQWWGATAMCRLIGSGLFASQAMRLLPRVYLTGHSEPVRAIQRRALVSAADSGRVSVFRQLWRSFADPCHDLREEATRIAIPTMLVWGTRDPLLRWRADGRRAARILADARTVRMRCGHQPYAELPAAFVDEVTGFLTSLRSG